MSATRRWLFRTKAGRLTVLLGFGLVLLLGVLGVGELACQVVFARQVREWAKWMKDPGQVMQACDNQVLAYEHKRNYSTVFEGRSVKLNAFGVRDDTNDLYSDRTRIALLGDSVTFGSGLDQAEAPPVRLQELLDPEMKSIKVLNFGTMGYGLAEMPAYLESLYPVYKPQVVVYMLNPNDFSMRDTVYEGGDGGLYRMFVHPTFKLPAALRKVIYRVHKGGKLVHPDWYTWMFDGTKAKTLPKIDQMQAYCKAHNVEFKVFMLPSRTSRGDEGAGMRRMYKEVGEYVKARNIPFADGNELFKDKMDEWLDISDHCTPEGAKGLASSVMKAFGLKTESAMLVP
jgi:lysophospholipase L1-like esterase